MSIALRDRLLALTGIGIFFAAWAAAIAATPETMVPGPWAVVMALVELASDGSLFEHIFASILRVACGYVAAVVTAVPFGVALGWYKRGERALNPLIQVFRPISPLAWIPLGILWFGVGNLTAIFLIYIASFLSITVAAMSAVRHIPLVNLRAGRNFGLGGMELMTRVIYPAIMPRLLVGLRLALGISWIVVVAAEMIAVRSGLGYLIIDSRNAGNRYDLVVAGMVMIGAIGVLLDYGMRQMERLKAVRWGYHEQISNDRARRAATRST